MLGRNRGGPREDLGRVAVVMILEVVVEDNVRELPGAREPADSSRPSGASEGLRA